MIHVYALTVYDIESRRVVLRIEGHHDEVNAVCFADESSNILYSGSDDTFIKVWYVSEGQHIVGFVSLTVIFSEGFPHFRDRRSMRNEKPSGVLVGHLEGITYVSSKGDGRYCLSNSKDQTMKLWDIR